MEHKQIVSESGKALLERVRRICMKLPEVAEKVDGFGHSSFRVKDKPFTMLGEHDAVTSLSIKASLETQDILLQQDRYVRTPYIGQHGWVSLRSTEDVDWKEVEELLVEGYCLAAPKRLVKQLMETAT